MNSNESPGFKPVTHVVFDVDGLLLDTETQYTEMMKTLAAKYNAQFSWDIKVKQMGKKQSEAGKIFIDELKIAMTVDEYISQLNELMTIYFPQAQLMPGADRLIRHLYKHNVPMALATGSHQAEFKMKTASHLDLFSTFHHTVCASDDPEVKHGKPAPDCFLVAASRFQDRPASEKVLVFEDAPNGVTGALAAGMQVVWVPDHQCPMPEESWNNERRVLRLKSLDDFKPEQFGLPAYD